MNKGLLDRFLSKKGQDFFFPQAGILSQTAEARGVEHNATIGMAMDEGGQILHLQSLDKYLDLKPREIYPYAPSFGLPALRGAWQAVIRKHNPGVGEFSVPVVTQAITHALSVAGTLLVDPGQEVIVFEPFWGNYRLIMERYHQAKLRCLPLFLAGSQGWNLEALEEVLMEVGQRKVLLLNFPNNPTGYSPLSSEVEVFVSLIKKVAEAGKELVVIVDDAYFGLFYEQEVFQESIFGQLSSLHENILAVKVDGATKEFFVWGLRVGFISFGGGGLKQSDLEVLEQKAAGVVRASISNASLLSQQLVVKALESKEAWQQKESADRLLEKRYRQVREILAGHPEYEEVFRAWPFNSGYFMCVEVKGVSAEAVRKELLDRGVGVIALGNLLRVAYSSVSTSQLAGLFEEMYRVCMQVRA